MIVMLSARRLKPGAWDQFRRAWDPGDAKPPGFQRAYHARNIRDDDEVISFGLFDMTEDEYRSWRAEADAQLAAGTYGLSVESGEPIPDERLEALPTAERTVKEQRGGR